MDKRLRPIPYPAHSQAYQDRYEQLRRFQALTHNQALTHIAQANKIARNTPLKGERCLANSKQNDWPCQCLALPSGRCKYHGGVSAPQTPEGRENQRVAARAWCLAYHTRKRDMSLTVAHNVSQ